MPRRQTIHDDLPDAAWRRFFRQRLMRWYAKTARDLPWRESRDVYRVWVSEVMLQQTQVRTVEAYFLRFVERYPTIAELAAADEQDVLRLWEGLGYYRRARQLHQAARQIMAQHDGHFPRQPREVQALPGIGRYTAGAILSIAFDAREPVLEANTTRLLTRLLAYDRDLGTAEAQRKLWAMAGAILPTKNVGVFNQALMELGSLICKPVSPLCDECPVVSSCAAFATGSQDRIPLAAKKLDYEERREAAVVIRRRGRVLLRLCGPDERWAGLWDFPRVEVDNRNGAALRRQLIGKIRKLTGVTAEPGQRLKTIKHGVTRFRITLECYDAAYVAGPDRAAASNGGSATEQKWLRPGDLDRYPLSTTGRKLARLLAQKTARS